MENEKVIDGGLLRFKAILASESFGTPDDLEFQDDADVIHADAVEAPIVDPVAPVTAVETVVPAPSDPPQLLPGQFILSDSLCVQFNKPRGYILADMDEFAGLFLGISGEEYRTRAAKRKTRDEQKRRAAPLPVKRRHRAA